MIAPALAGERRTELTYYAEDSDARAGLLAAVGGLEVRIVGGSTTRACDLAGEPTSECGRFHEISVEVDAVELAVEFWERLGYRREQGGTTWATLSDGVMRIGVYLRGSCPHRFGSPSLTYFEPNMQERIERLEERGVEFVEELPDEGGTISSAVAVSPDGQQLFLFHYGGEF